MNTGDEKNVGKKEHFTFLARRKQCVYGQLSQQKAAQHTRMILKKKQSSFPPVCGDFQMFFYPLETTTIQRYSSCLSDA